jgi:hypothetical protein
MQMTSYVMILLRKVRNLPMKILKQMSFFALALLVVSCTSSPGGGFLATKTPTTNPTPASTPIPIDVLPDKNETGEILRISGIGPDSSQTFLLDVETIVRVKWEQSSTGNFKLFIISLDPAQAETPYGRVLFEMTTGPSSGFADFSFIAGEYQIDIEKSDGPWEIWITRITY